MGEMGVELPPAVQFPRSQAKHVSLDDKFELKRQRYQGQQYSQIYVFRIKHAKQYMVPLVRARWPNYPVTNILGLEEGEECIVIGTLYKQMRLKPNVLDEYSKERSVVPLVTPRSFTAPDDCLILEDEGGRTLLVGGGFSPAFYVTGVVVAVRGEAGSDGEFHVKDILEPGLAPQPPLPVPVEEDKYVAFVSGLRIGSNDTNPLQVQLLVDHLTGHLGGGQEQKSSAQIVRVIIAGDSVQFQAKSLTGQPLNLKEQRKLSEPMRELDIFVTQLAASVPVDIMPGARDPANFSLPQQPLHRCLFPGASEYSTFVSATNPHQFVLDGVPGHIWTEC